MRDLNLINGAAKSTAFMFSISLVIPLVMGCGAWILAVRAAPKQALSDNYLGMIGLGISSISIIMLPIPYLFRWNWESRYFGAAILSLSSMSVIGIYPLLCIAQYSSLPILVRLALVIMYTAAIIVWCRRFVKIYKVIYSKKLWFHSIYFEEPSEVYFSQQADNKIIEKLLKFEQFPRPKYFIYSGLISFSMIPFATAISQSIAIPFTHIFLAIFAIPLSLLFLGLSTKAWLVFYFYPMKIRKETNKPVYVDISSKAPKCLDIGAIKKNS